MRKSFVSTRGHEYFADLLFSVVLDDCRALLYLVLEHKSSQKRPAVMQIGNYVQSLIRDLVKAHLSRPGPR